MSKNLLRLSLLVCVGAMAPAVQAAPAKKAAAKTAAKTAEAPAAAPEPAEPVDISSVKDTMRVVTDGKGHYIAFPALAKLSDFLFYGDGKVFWHQRVYSGGSEGDIRFSRTFWEPRSAHRSGSSFEFRDKKFFTECDERKTELTLVPEAEAKAMIASAKFYKPRWKFRAYLLARDEQGRYYYVDRAREPEDSKNFRLYMGPKGNLKLQKMTNVVEDSEGVIFSTKTGSLRLISGQTGSTWIEGAVKLKLTSVPVDTNAPLIYNDLGVYAGMPLGTPCDDM